MSDIGKHRPVRLRAILGKLFTRIMLTRVKLYIEPHIPKCQLGFQAMMNNYVSTWATKNLVRVGT